MATVQFTIAYQWQPFRIDPICVRCVRYGQNQNQFSSSAIHDSEICFIQILYQIAQFVHQFFLLSVEFSSDHSTPTLSSVLILIRFTSLQSYGDPFWSSQKIANWIDSVHGNRFQGSAIKSHKTFEPYATSTSTLRGPETLTKCHIMHLKMAKKHMSVATQPSALLEEKHMAVIMRFYL